MPNEANRSSDAAWVRREAGEQLTDEQQERFAPICPEFVVELRSPDDNLAHLKGKMEEYIQNGTLLGSVFEPKKKKVHVYRPGLSVERLDNARRLSAAPVLRGFSFDPGEIW